MYRNQVAQQMMRRNSPRPKGTRLARNQNNGASSSVASSRNHSDVEDEFEREMNVFVEQLMSGTSTPKNIEDSAKLTEEYDAAVMQYVNEAATTGAPVSQSSAAAEARKTIGYNVNYEILSKDRRSTSQSLRHSALERIINQLAAKYDPTMFKYSNLEVLQKAFSTGRTSQEIAQAAKAITLLAALNIDESVEFVQQYILVPVLAIVVDEDRDLNLRASLATTYGLLQSFINTGSQGFGLEDKVRALLDVATASSTSADQAVLTSSALLAVSLVVGAINARNNLIEEILPEIVELLKSPSGDVSNNAGKAIALLYEIYDFSDQYDESTFDDSSYAGFGGYRFEIPAVENRDIIDDIRSMQNTAASRHGKNVKQEQRSVFRKVLSFLEVRLQIVNPDNALTEEGRLLALDEAISHIRLSRAKALPIDTWGQLALSQGLKWLYGNSLPTQLANNQLVVDLVKEAGPEEHPDYPGASSEAAYALSLEAEFKDVDSERELSERDREKSIQKGRDQKRSMLTGSS